MFWIESNEEPTDLFVNKKGGYCRLTFIPHIFE